VLGREVEDDAMVALAQEGFAGCLGGEQAGLAFDAEVVGKAAVPCNQPNDGLGEVGIEIVADDIPSCIGCGTAQQAVEKAGKILFGASVADDARDLAGGDIEAGNQGLSAVLKSAPPSAATSSEPGHVVSLRRQSRAGSND